MDDQAKRIRAALLAERRARITAQQDARRSEIAERQAQRREELTQEQLQKAALLREERLRQQLARAAARTARKERLIIIFKKPTDQQK